MRRGDHHRPATLRVVVLAALVGTGALALVACGSDAASSTTVQVPAPAATQPATTAAPVTTGAPDMTEAAVSTTSLAPATTVAPTPVATEPVSSAVPVTDADVADLEKQLDEIDQLLAGVDADLSQD